MIDPNDTLAHVATSHPLATRVFLRHRLDFCCGGGRKLTEACHAVGLDPDAVVAEIAAEDDANGTVRWDVQPMTELVDFILARFHEPLRRDLPGLIEAARKVEHVHANEPTCPKGLASHLAQMDSEIRQHLAKEEQVLFPAIQAGRGGPAMQMPIRVMMQEHDDHGASLQRLRQLTTQYEAPPQACATWRALYAGLATLEAELMEHIHLENNVLFPRALNA